MKKEMKNNQSVDISDEMISSLVSLSVTGVNGVDSISIRATDEIKDILSMTNTIRGVKITRGVEGMTIWVYVLTEPGVKIVNVSKAIQEKVKLTVESMVGIPVLGVNVRIEGSGI